MLSVRESDSSNRRSGTRKPPKYVATTQNIAEYDEMASDLGRLGGKANISRVFCPPPLTEPCKRLRAVDDGIVRLLAHITRQHAYECEYSASRQLNKVDFMSQERRRKRDEYPPTFPEYLDHSVLEGLSSELEQASFTDSEVSNATELFIGMTKAKNLKNAISVRSLDHNIKTHVNDYKKVSQQLSAPVKVFTPTSPLPLKGGVLPRKLLNRAAAVVTSTNLPRESSRYKNLPFGLVVENFETVLMLTPPIQPDPMHKVDAVKDAEIRFDLPHPLSDLRGMNVLEYIMRCCVVQSTLGTLLKDQYQLVQPWQKSVPIELLKEHVDKALLQMVPVEELEEFLEYFEFEPGFVMNEKVYVKALALSIRLYGHCLKTFHSSFWMYHVSPLECIDFRHLSSRLTGIELNPHLNKLLQRLGQIAADQFQS
ncbi:hypothetical protein TSMEX_001261 [Taenia solium]|eukprot:TsM_000599200 transcript=TsM_000599200 gene=TsM_000599200